MEIYLDRRSAKQIRLSVADAIREGDTETLREDMVEAFTEDHIEEIERRIDSADFDDFVTDILDEWSGEDADELFELLEAQLSDVGIDLKYHMSDLDDEEDEGGRGDGMSEADFGIDTDDADEL